MSTTTQIDMRHEPRRRAAIEIVQAQHDRRDAARASRRRPRRSVSLATETNRSSRSSAPFSPAGSSGRLPARCGRATGTARGRTPLRPPACCGSSTARRNGRRRRAADPRANVARAGGSTEAVGSSSSSRRGRLSIALARLSRVDSPDDSTPALAAAAASDRIPRSASSMRARKLGDAIDHAEDAQVLLDGEIAGQRAVDGGEIGLRHRARPVAAIRSTPSISMRPALGAARRAPC